MQKRAGHLAITAAFIPPSVALRVIMSATSASAPAIMS